MKGILLSRVDRENLRVSGFVFSRISADKLKTDSFIKKLREKFHLDESENENLANGKFKELKIEWRRVIWIFEHGKWQAEFTLYSHEIEIMED